MRNAADFTLKWLREDSEAIQLKKQWDDGVEIRKELMKKLVEKFHQGASVEFDYNIPPPTVSFKTGLGYFAAYNSFLRETTFCPEELADCNGEGGFVIAAEDAIHESVHSVHHVGGAPLRRLFSAAMENKDTERATAVDLKMRDFRLFTAISHPDFSDPTTDSDVYEAKPDEHIAYHVGGYVKRDLSR